MHLYDLSRLQGASPFLAGARIPLQDPTRPTDTWEWIENQPYVRRPGQVIFQPVAQPSWPGTLAMDLNQAHVARSMDQRIAKLIGLFHGEVPASLTVIPGYGWHLREGGNLLELKAHVRRSRAQPFKDACAAVKKIDCTSANLPVARAALLDALFGVRA